MEYPSHMRAWTCRRYGPPSVLRLESLPLRALGAQEVLIKVAATTVSSGDARIRGMRLPPGFGLLGRVVIGLNGPRQPVLGTEVSGVNAAVGNGVSRFKVGERVIAFPDTRMRGHAEYLIMPESGKIVVMPEELSFEEAASLCFGGLTARSFIKRSGLTAGESLLVIGASGAVGTAFVQLAKHLGAHVTTVTSARNIELMRQLGADQVVDYGRETVLASEQVFDVVADCVATANFKACLPILKEGGRYLSLAGGLSDMFGGKKGTKRSIAGPAASKLDDLQALVELVKSGAYRPVIDRVVAFDALPEAHALVDSGRKVGSVVVRVQRD